MTTKANRARIKVRNSEEFERWRRLAKGTQKRRYEGEAKDDTSSFRSEDESVA